MRSRKIRFTLASLVIAIMAFTSVVVAESDHISVQLKWLHDAQFAGFYVAEQRGLYEAEGLDVELVAGGIAVDEIQAVASGQHTFGVVDPAILLQNCEKGSPIVAIAVIYRIFPSVCFALSESGITKPSDFVGKRVIVNPENAALPAMLARTGIAMDMIVPIEPTHDMSSFFAGEVDVWSGYLIKQVIAARVAGYDLNVIYPDDYGVHFYGDTIITTAALVESNPDLVTRFLRATLAGWRWAIENPSLAGPIALDYDPTLNAQDQIDIMRASVPLIHTGEGPIGWMDASLWKGMQDILVEFGSLEGTTSAESAYTMEFLEALYETNP